MIGARLTPFFYEKFTLINKASSGVEVFEHCENNSKQSFKINEIKVLLRAQVSQLLKALGLNLSKKREKNIKNSWIGNLHKI